MKKRGKEARIPGAVWVRVLQAHGWSLRRIAREVGVHHETVRRWIRREKRYWPKQEKYLKLQKLALQELVGDRSLRKAAAVLGVPRTTLARHLRGQTASRDPGKYVASPYVLSKVLKEPLQRTFYIEKAPRIAREKAFHGAVDDPSSLPYILQGYWKMYVVPPEEAVEVVAPIWLENFEVDPRNEREVERIRNWLYGTFLWTLERGCYPGILAALILYDDIAKVEDLKREICPSPKERRVRRR